MRQQVADLQAAEKEAQKAAQKAAAMAQSVRLAFGCSVRLREGPGPRHALKGETLCHERELRVLSWNIEGGYLHVTTGLEEVETTVAGWMGGLAPGTEASAGWIRTQHVTCVHDGKVYTPLTDELWYDRHWRCYSESCTIIVTRGARTNEEGLAKIAVELEAMVPGDRPHKQHRRRMQDFCTESDYTYVCLDIGRPFRIAADQPLQEVCRNGWHITLGYVAPMPELQMNRLRSQLTRILLLWRSLEPNARPCRLIHCREFEIQKEEEDGVRRLRIPRNREDAMEQSPKAARRAQDRFQHDCRRRRASRIRAADAHSRSGTTRPGSGKSYAALATRRRPRHVQVRSGARRSLDRVAGPAGVPRRRNSILQSGVRTQPRREARAAILDTRNEMALHETGRLAMRAPTGGGRGGAT